MRKHPQLLRRRTSLLEEHFTCSYATTSLATSLPLHGLSHFTAELLVQYRFHRSAAFATQSAAVPAERAVLKAKLSKLRKVFFKN